MDPIRMQQLADSLEASHHMLNQPPPPPGPPPKRWWKVALGLPLLVGGGIALAWGILGVAATNSDIAGSEVHRFSVPQSVPTLSMAALPAGEYTLYTDVADMVSDDRMREEARRTECTVSFSDGRSITITGSRQASAVATDDFRSIGTFTATGGTTTFLCTRGRDILLSDVRDLVVAEGTPASAGWERWVALFAGAFTVLPALMLLGSGLTGRRVGTVQMSWGGS